MASGMEPKVARRRRTLGGSSYYNQILLRRDDTSNVNTLGMASPARVSNHEGWLGGPRDSGGHHYQARGSGGM